MSSLVFPLVDTLSIRDHHGLKVQDEKHIKHEAVKQIRKRQYTAGFDQYCIETVLQILLQKPKPRITVNIVRKISSTSYPVLRFIPLVKAFTPCEGSYPVSRLMLRVNAHTQCEGSHPVSSLKPGVKAHTRVKAHTPCQGSNPV